MADPTGRTRGKLVRLPPETYEAVKREAQAAGIEIGAHAAALIEAGRKVAKRR
jgi:hypothetical protein